MCVPYLESLLGFLIRVPYLGSLFGFLIWVLYLGSLLGFLIWVSYSGSLVRFLIQVLYLSSLFGTLIYGLHLSCISMWAPYSGSLSWFLSLPGMVGLNSIQSCYSLKLNKKPIVSCKQKSVPKQGRRNRWVWGAVAPPIFLEKSPHFFSAAESVGKEGRMVIANNIPAPPIFDTFLCPF